MAGLTEDDLNTYKETFVALQKEIIKANDWPWRKVVHLDHVYYDGFHATTMDGEYWCNLGEERESVIGTLKIKFNCTKVMEIRIGGYRMYKMTSRYEYERFSNWYEVFVTKYKKNRLSFLFKLQSFDEFNQQDWLNKWLDKVIRDAPKWVKGSDINFKRRWRKANERPSITFPQVSYSYQPYHI
jgi:hypothetical protein